MKAETLDMLRCPECDGELALDDGATSDALEIVTGEIRCGSCEAQYSIDRGMVFLTSDRRRGRVAEAADRWRRHDAEQAEVEGLYDALPIAPRVPVRAGANGYDVTKLYDVDMRASAWNLDVLRDLLAGNPSPTILDLGSRSGWSTSLLAREIPGARVLASDVLDDDLVGLGLGRRRYFDRDNVFYERLVLDPADRALAPGSVDVVHAHLALHRHAHLGVVAERLADALRPDGVLCALEPIVSLDTDKRAAVERSASWREFGLRGAGHTFLDLYDALHGAGFEDIRLYPYALLDPTLGPDAYDRDLMLPFYPLPQKYRVQCKTSRRSLFDMMASFRYENPQTPFHVLIFASKKRDLSALDDLHVRKATRLERVERARRHAFVVEAPVELEPTAEPPARTKYGRPASQAFADNVALREAEMKAGKTRLESYPSRIAIDLTARCNLRCIMCLRHQWTPEERKRTLTYETWLKLRPWLYFADELVMGAGGENLMHPRIADILRDLGEFPHLFRVLTSNGTLIHRPELFDLIVTNLDRVGISIEGATKASYEKIRPGAKFDRIVENIGMMTDHARTHGTGLEVIFQTVPMRENLHELPTLVDLANDLGVQHIAAQHLIAIKGMEQFHREQNVFDIPEEWNAVLAEVQARAEAHGILLNFPGPLEVGSKKKDEEECAGTCELIHGKVLDEGRSSFLKPESKCYDPWEVTQLPSDGGLNACCYIWATALDDHASIREAYNSENMREVRRTVNASDPDLWPGFCRVCQKRM